MKLTYSEGKAYRHIKIKWDDIDGYIFVEHPTNIPEIWNMGISSDMKNELQMTFGIITDNGKYKLSFIDGYKQLKNTYPLVDFSKLPVIDYVLYNINDTKLMVSAVFENEDFTLLHIVSENAVDSYYETLQEAIDYFNEISVLD